ncbi:MAG: hypothetical protein KME06_18880 [Kastovskya adunca ATA6-11-RM4]|jgi:hypothetical protein|nr:hypothetical protein [Kastovskya adunca ATA6-11-RM4]
MVRTNVFVWEKTVFLSQAIAKPSWETDDNLVLEVSVAVTCLKNAIAFPPQL